MKSTFAALALFLSTICVLPATAADSDPATPVHKLSDALIETMKQGDQLGMQGRENKLRPVITSAYDLPAVTKNTLGTAANKLSPEDLQKLADAYGRFSVATYADQFAKFGVEHFEVGTPRPGALAGTDVVPSVIVGGDNSRTEIDYVVHQEANGAWGIIDVLFNGSISQVAVRRSELVPIFRQKGLQGLIDVLDQKTSALEKK
jgi:phospholipid transport system substrate-binding protein